MNIGVADVPSNLRRQEKFIADLLEYRAPPPAWQNYLKAHPRSALIPASAADSATLVNYWSNAPDDARPDEKTRMRLVEIIEQQPASAPSLLRWLPNDSAEVHDRVKTVEENEAKQKSREAESIHKALRDWLMLHSKYFRDELKRRILLPDDVSQNDADEAQSAFVKLDPRDAKQFFLEQANTHDSKKRAIALAALLGNFGSNAPNQTRDEWRRALNQIASDRKAPTDARRVALPEVMKENWDGRDTWFLNLFNDQSVLIVEEFSEFKTLVGEIVLQQADYWIPKITPLVKGSGTSRTNAIYCLVQFQRERARTDALKPLLPWINNSRWAPDSEKLGGRARLLANLDRVDLPESVPALLDAAKTATGFELEYIATALAHYKSKEAIPLLKKAIAREKDESHRRRIVAAINTLNGFSDAEIVDALRAFAIKASNEAGAKDIEEADDVLPKNILQRNESIGDQFTRTEIANPQIIEQLRKAAEALRPTNPVAADTLQQIVGRCAAPGASDAIVAQLRTGDFGASWAAELLDKRKPLGPAFKKLKDLEGVALGLQTALVDDPEQIDSVLTSNDRFAKLCLLASARLAQVSLPIEKVGPLLDQNDENIKKAARLYLEANDSAAARAVLWRQAEAKPLILGSRLNYDPGHWTYGPFGKTEAQLVRMLKEANGPTSVFALLSEGYWGGIGQRVLLVYPDRSVLQSEEGNGRVRERRVETAEADVLLKWLEHEQIDDLPPYDEHTWDGIQYEYFRASRDSARRVFMNNPPSAPTSASAQPAIDEEPGRPEPRVYSELTQRFLALNERHLDVRYPSLEKIPGYRLVHEREDGEVFGFAIRDGKPAASIRPGSQNSLEWHSLSDDGLSKEFSKEPIDEGPKIASEETNKPVAIKEGPFAGRKLRAVWAGEDREAGLWILDKFEKTQLIAKGIFGQPVSCPGGEWIVVAKTEAGKMWDVPNGVFRIHLPDKRVFSVDIPRADNFDPIVWIEARKRVLLYRQRDPENWQAGPEKPEFCLLDPFSGTHEKVDGEFRPFFDASKHELQPTGNPNEFWATLHSSVIDSEMHTTAIGKFDSYNFHFSPVLNFPDLNFDSSNVFVDETSHKVWINLNGDLIRFSMP